MQKFTTLTGVAAPMPMINIDTDKIIPKQHLKTIARTGLGKALFDELRYKNDGSENPDFILNKAAYRKAKILVAGENFGCGSSREHAPWALLDFGITCVISTSFADIFYNNCFKNGILPIKLPQADVDKLMDDAERDRGPADTGDLGIAAYGIADRDWLHEDDVRHRDGDDPTVRALGRRHLSGGIHQRHDPAAEDVAHRVGVGGHRQRPIGELA